MAGAHSLLGTFRSGVDLFVTPSEFARGKFVEAGWDGGRIVVKPNSVHPDPGPGGERDGYALFVGRLERIKGIEPLLAAWTESSADLRLKIVGDGPLLPMVVEAAAADERIEVLGMLEVTEIHRLLRAARFVVVPSLWYETFGRVVAEAFAAGTPVIVSDLGALSELVADGVDGVIVEPGNVTDLRKAIEHLTERDDMDSMHLAARATFEATLEGQANVRRLLEIYSLAVERSAGRHTT